jgi:hypothetical protein
MKNKHSIIGLILVAVLFFQAPLGYLHHVLFKRTGSRTLWSHVHLWIARLVIPVGIVNAVFGLELAEEPLWKLIAVAAVGGCMWAFYVISTFIGEWRRNRAVRHNRDRPDRGNSGEMRNRTNSTREVDRDSRPVQEHYYSRPYTNKRAAVYAYEIDENDLQLGYGHGAYFWPTDAGGTTTERSTSTIPSRNL